MGKPVFFVGSITYAMKGRDLLAQYGIYSQIKRMPRVGNTGCGYGIYVTDRVSEVEQILHMAGIPIKDRKEWGYTR